jgi:nicotinamidase-related amidase
MRLSPATTAIYVIDVQERLAAAVPDAARVIERSGRLVEAARLLGVPRLLTEQYPRGLGRTVPDLVSQLPPPVEKMSFSCLPCLPPPAGVEAVVLAGLETHVCVTQTALDILATGRSVFIAVDAVAARHAIDHEVGLRRLETAGAVLTTTEAVLFEWCRTAEHPQFQAIRRLVL